jgi:PKD repeat protein
MLSGRKIRERLFAGLLFGALGLAALPAAAVDYYLAAKQFTMSMPDGTGVPMWGYVLDPGGTCYNTTPISARLACVNALPAPTIPGPRLTVAPNEAGNALRVFLTNGLPVPTSIVVPGQEMPFSDTSTTSPNQGPTWDNGTTGPARPSVASRVRSFGREAAPNGGREQYIWNNTRGNPFQPGTYTYHSGTHPQVQVQMGLYGAVTRDAAAGQAYAGVGYDTARDLFYSEVDPALHQAVANGAYGTPPGPTSTLNYQPKYFLLQSYDAGGLPVDVSINPGNQTCIGGGLTAGDRILLRLYSAGLRELTPMMIGSHFDVVAEGGRKAPFAHRQYHVLLMPGSTRDLIFTPGYDGTFPLIERRLNLTDNAQMNGGMQTCFTIAAAGGNSPPTASAGGPYNGVAGLPIAFNAGASTDCSPTPCTPEGDSLSYTWNFGDATSGSGVTPSHAYAAAGTYNVTVTVDDGVNPPVTSPLTTATVAANQVPTANPNGPYSGRTGFPIAFNGTGSSDPEGQPLSYNWNFGDGNTGSGATPSHAYAAPGTYTVTLTVNDGFQNSAPASTTATVIDNVAPVANPGGPYNSTSTTVTFNGAGSSDGNGDTLTYAWNFGDGGTGSGATPTHTYAQGSGTTFTVTLVVNDGYVDSAPATTTVTITGSGTNNAPVANNDAFNPDATNTVYTVAAPGVLGNDTDSDGPNPLTAQLVSVHQDLKNFVWNGDGSFSFGPMEKVGTFPVTYRAFDGQDTSNLATVNVTREIRVTKAEFTGDANQRWTISGKSSANGVISIYLGPTLGGTLLGTATVSGGNWSFTQSASPNPGTPGAVISVDNLGTTGGAVLSVPITCKKC